MLIYSYGRSRHCIVAALDGWQRERHRFATRYFLSPQTLDHITRLRADLGDSARELLQCLPPDRTDSTSRAEGLAATLVAGLFPNLAWLRRFGKGETCAGLKVVAPPPRGERLQTWSLERATVGVRYQ